MTTIDDIMGKNFDVYRRFAEVRDAAFILRLRQDEKLGRFLSVTNPDVSVQEKWLEQYKTREGNKQEFYFVFCRGETHKPYGVNRIYNLDQKSFEVGSWLFSDESPEGLSVLADLSSRDYAFSVLNAEYCRFEVRKENRSVVNYHKRFRPELTGEDESNYYFKLERDKYMYYRNQLLKFYGYGIK